jgi:type II secretory pathway component PulF
MPVVGKMLHDARVASFSEILSLLVEHDVPLVTAVPLAADASSDRQLSAAARDFAKQLERGVAPNDLAGSTNGLPPFFVWTIAAGQRKERLVSLLKQSADLYRRTELLHEAANDNLMVW